VSGKLCDGQDEEPGDSVHICITVRYSAFVMRDEHMETEFNPQAGSKEMPQHKIAIIETTRIFYRRR
jgi:hypothetical protein